MSKNVTAILAAIIFLVLTTGAWAQGPGGAMGMGICPMGQASVSPEQAQRFAQFQSETLPLRQKMLQIKSELMTLRVQPTKDWKAIADKQKEMVDVKTEIHKKADAVGIPVGRGMCGGPGAGRMGKPCMGMGMGRI